MDNQKAKYGFLHGGQVSVVEPWHSETWYLEHCTLDKRDIALHWIAHETAIWAQSFKTLSTAAEVPGYKIAQLAT